MSMLGWIGGAYLASAVWLFVTMRRAPMTTDPDVHRVFNRLDRGKVDGIARKSDHRVPRRARAEGGPRACREGERGLDVQTGDGVADGTGDSRRLQDGGNRCRSIEQEQGPISKP